VSLLKIARFWRKSGKREGCFEIPKYPKLLMG